MKLTTQRLKQLIREELASLNEVGYLETEEDLKDWTCGFTGDPNDPLPSTVAKHSADLEAAKTLTAAMDPDELEQLLQHITDILAEPGAPSSDWDEDTPPLDLSDHGIGNVLASPGINKDLDRLKRRARRTVGGGK